MEHVRTKSHSRALLLSTVIAAGLALAQAAPAQEASSEAAGPYATYLMSVGGMGREQALNAARAFDRRRAVAPEQLAQATPAQEASFESPGPYAKYLMSVGGMGREQALNAARTIDRPRATALSAAHGLDQGERSAQPKLAHGPDQDDNGASH